MTLIGSGFSNVDSTSDARGYISRLDDTGTSPFWQAVKHRMSALLDLQSGDHLLDVGCGTGDDVRVLAQLVGPAGRAVGVDSSVTMITEARRRSLGADVSTEFLQADAHSLSFPDGSFNACRAERVLQHLDCPGQACSEMVRVARPGARIVVVEPDYGTLAISGADPVLTRTVQQCRRDHFRSGTIARQLPKLFKELELRDVSVTILTTVSTDIRQTNMRRRLQKYATEAQATGAISEDDTKVWLRDLEAAAKAGRFRYATAVVLAYGQKP